MNPVTLRQFDPRGKLLTQIEAVRSSTAGKLLPTDSFAQSSYTALTTWKYTECCFVSSLWVYHTIPASGVGASGVNYNETTYGYDSLKRRNREVSQGGTIIPIGWDTFMNNGTIVFRSKTISISSLCADTWSGMRCDQILSKMPGTGVGVRCGVERGH